ncbi:MAG: preprotein translocase subunit SecY [Lentisphaeria bacterium]
MLGAYTNSLKIPELRKRIIFTLAILALCRLAAGIPCPGLNAAELGRLFDNLQQGGGGLMNIVNIFSGGALQKFAVGTLGIMPYITASIIMQLLMPVIPALEKLRREGESGRQKINQYTRYLTLAVCVVHGTAAVRFMVSPGGMLSGDQTYNIVKNPGFGFAVTTVVFLAAGTMLLVWLGEQISDRGIGNGISLIITINILSRLPMAIGGLFALAQGTAGTGGGGIIQVLLLIVLFLIVCAGAVALTQGHRKVPIRHARRTAGRQSNAGQTSYLPLRVNYSGVMPIIFGSAILMFPTVILRQFQATAEYVRYFQYGSWPYMITFGIVILLFSFFWVATQFKPTQIADNLQKQGGYVPGIRPGQPTATFLDNTMSRLTLAGAIFLTGIAVVPMLLSGTILQIPQSVASFFGGTSLLIMVGVVLDTMRQMEAYLLSHHYDGFMKKGKLRSRHS